MENLKAFGKEVWLFLSSGIFLKNFAMMIGLVVGIALFSNWFLGCYTNHGESVQVDDFTGMELSDAERQGRDKDFEFEILAKKWEEGKPFGIILSQSPQPLSRVKEGRKIYVTVTGEADAVRLPNFKQSEYEFERYAKKLGTNDIKSKIVERVYDKKQAEGSILYFYHNGKKVTENQVKAGYDVMRGDLLEFVVTEQRSNELQVPDIVCMNYSAAEFLVSSSNLIIGTVNEEGSVTSQSTAYITQQDPPAGQSIQMGGQITVWISQTQPPGCDEGQDAPTDEPTDGQ